jgi:hypothetical protein
MGAAKHTAPDGQEIRQGSLPIAAGRSGTGSQDSQQPNIVSIIGKNLERIVAASAGAQFYARMPSSILVLEAV